MKPLFVPLMTKYWDAFANGTKRTEYRLLRGPWNCHAVTVGRPVVLSKGYSGARLHGVVTRVRCMTVGDVPGMRDVYPNAPASSPVLAFSVRID